MTVRSGNRKLVALCNALVSHLEARQSANVPSVAPGAMALWIAPPQGLKMRQTEILEYPSMLTVVRTNYSVRLYATPEGWAFGFEYEPDDDLFPFLIYRSGTAWSKDDALEAAWDKAVTTHAGLWGPNGKRSIAKGKPDPKEYRKVERKTMYVALDATP